MALVSGFLFILLLVTLAGLKNIVCYSEDFVRKVFVTLRFHC